MTAPKTIVAVLDDEVKMRTSLARLLKANGFEVKLFETGHQFLSAGLGTCADCLLLDLQMPGITGFEVLEALLFQPAGPPVIVITGRDEPGNAERVESLGAADYLLKPVDESTLLRAIYRACGGQGRETDFSN